MMKSSHKDREMPKVLKEKMMKKSDKEYRMGAEQCPKCKGDKKKCPGGKACPMTAKKDMGRKSPYADGMCGKRGDIAAEFSSVMLSDAEREDKPCGNSYIPEAAKCAKGRGNAKASMKSLKKRALAKEQEVNKGRSVAEQKRRENVPKDKEYKQLRQVENEMNKEQAQSALSDKQKRKAIRKVAGERFKGVKTERLKASLKANKGNKTLEGRTVQKAARRELFNRGAQTTFQSALLGAPAGMLLESRRNKRRS